MRSAIDRLSGAWQTLGRERRLVAIASLGLFVSMLLPWYQQNAVVNAPRTAPLQSRNLDAFEVFSFVEAAVLLVAVAILYMLFARAEGRDFHLPGGDGTVVFAAGLWAAALLVLRLFDKPGISSHGIAGNVGVQWGIFFALAAAGLLAYAGGRLRAVEHPEPPLSRPRPRGPHDPEVRTPEHRPSSEQRTTPLVTPPAEQRTTPVTTPPPPRRREGSLPVPAGDRGSPEAERGSRPRYPPAPPDQMSFEDPPQRSGS
jgi:hypothetical protein